jgi:hypothetical protein
MTSLTTSCANDSEPGDRWPDVTASWIENWPPALAALSFAQVGVPLTPAQVHSLGHANGVDRHCFRNGAEIELLRLESDLDAVLRGFPSGTFVRLGSRSPKDTRLGLLTGCRAFTGADAVRLLTAGSRRVAFDLRRCLRDRLVPHVFLRAWQEIDGWDEVRCFWQAGRLLGTSQYHHRATVPDEVRAGLAAHGGSAIARFIPRFAAAWGAADIVFDLWLARKSADTFAVLIEINPWGPPTDPCLFSWSKADFDGSFRLKSGRDIEALALPIDGSVLHRGKRRR